jgi:hypothetical protein
LASVEAAMGDEDGKWRFYRRAGDGVVPVTAAEWREDVAKGLAGPSRRFSRLGVEFAAGFAGVVPIDSPDPPEVWMLTAKNLANGEVLGDYFRTEAEMVDKFESMKTLAEVWW